MYSFIQEQNESLINQPEQDTMLVRNRRVVAGIGFLAAGICELMRFFDVGKTIPDGTSAIETIGSTAQFALECAIIGVSLAVLNKNHPKQP